MKAHALAVAVVLLACVTAAYASWEPAVVELATTDADSDVESLIEAVVDADPYWSDVAAVISGLEFGAAAGGEPVLGTLVCADTLELPWVVLPPPDYDPEVAAPLLVLLHGGVSAPSVTDDPVGYAEEHPLAQMASDAGWITACPFGMAGATWFDEVGMGNIRALVRRVKTDYNVDDDRVWMAGFSDGASAGFLHAMLTPDDYAAFVALNGHMGVGSLDGGLPTYAPNMFNTPIYAVTTFNDELYPSSVMRGTIEMALEAGADIQYREFEGVHDMDDPYVARELLRIRAFLARHPRDPFPQRIVWESEGPKYGRCRWLAIDAVTVDPPEPWHVDHNVALTDERVTIGFHYDDTFAGPGILVSAVVEGDYPAAEMGLKEGDVIVGGGGTEIEDIDDLGTYKSRLERGSDLELVVEREGQRVSLRGRIPPPSHYNLFVRDAPSALVRAERVANRIDIEASRLGAFRIFVDPQMFDIEQNIVVNVNGTTVFDRRVEPDIEYMLREFVEDRDRKRLDVAEIAIDLR